MLQTHEITPHALLELANERPFQLMEVARTVASNSKRRKATISCIKQLVDAGQLRMVLIDRFPHYVPAAWKASDELVELTIMGNTRQVADCLEWQGFIDSRGQPIMHISRNWGRDDLPQLLRARRFLWSLNSRRTTLTHEIVLHPKCGCRSCINPLHMQPTWRTRIAHGRKLMQDHRMAIIAGARNGLQSKLSMDDARAIRASSASNTQLAQQYGVTRANISCIRRGITWREHDHIGLAA